MTCNFKQVLGKEEGQACKHASSGMHAWHPQMIGRVRHTRVHRLILHHVLPVVCSMTWCLQNAPASTGVPRVDRAAGSMGPE